MKTILTLYGTMLLSMIIGFVFTKEYTFLMFAGVIVGDFAINTYLTFKD